MELLYGLKLIVEIVAIVVALYCEVKLIHAHENDSLKESVFYGFFAVICYVIFFGLIATQGGYPNVY